MANVIEERDARIMAAATECAMDAGFQWITREEVAARAGVSVGTVNTAYGTMNELKRAVLRRAVETENLAIVAQGLADGHEIARAAPAHVRAAAAAHIAGG